MGRRHRRRAGRSDLLVGDDEDLPADLEAGRLGEFERQGRIDLRDPGRNAPEQLVEQLEAASFLDSPAYRERKQVSLPVVPFFGERWVTGSYYGSANLQRDIPRLVDLYLGGRLDLDTLVARRYTLDQVNVAFKDLETGRPGRGIIVY